MDVMALRRGLMMAMAGGAQFVKGTFTVPDSGSSYTLNFGKTFESYLFLIEMDSASKTMLVNSGEDGNRIYAQYGMYPMRSINNETPSVMYAINRINPSTQAVSSYYGNGAVSANTPADSTKITFNSAAVTAGISYLYRGYTYNYYIVEIK